jgi:hypothetical protein
MRKHSRIQFFGDQSSPVARISQESQLQEVRAGLGLDSDEPVIVLVGGAAGIKDTHAQIINHITGVIANTAEDTGAIIIDGGTKSGVMAAIGNSRLEGNYHFPLVGVAVERLVTYPHKPLGKMKDDQSDQIAPLDPNHTHFVLVPGSNWGDESQWISKLASTLSGRNPSITILVNGGEISRLDVEHSLNAGREVVVINGSGRLADELAMTSISSSLLKIVSLDDETRLISMIKSILRKE